MKVCRPQRDLLNTTQAFVAANLTVFFNIGTDGTDAWFLHSIIAFSEPKPPGSASPDDSIYKGMFEGAFPDAALWNVAHGMMPM